jgi:hypothetical protein
MGRDPAPGPGATKRLDGPEQRAATIEAEGMPPWLDHLGVQVPPRSVPSFWAAAPVLRSGCCSGQLSSSPQTLQRTQEAHILKTTT